MTSTNKISDLFWEEYSNNYTGDLPYLRYGGPIPVWLYGNYTGFKWMDEVMTKSGCILGSDYKSHSLEVLSTKRYSMLNNYRNNASNPLSDFKSFLLPANLSVQGFTLTKKKIRGKLYTVSLRGLQALDRFFYTGFNFNRYEIGIEPTRASFSNGEEKIIDEAFTYFVKPKTIAKDSQVEKLPEGCSFIRPKESVFLSLPTSMSHSSGEMIYI